VRVSEPKSKHEREILRLVHSIPNISRIELSKATGLSAASISATVQKLMDRGLVIESGNSPSSLGRKPISLSIRQDAGFLIGVDLGSFHTRIVITNIRGAVLYKAEHRTGMQSGRDVVLSTTLEAIHKAIEDSGKPATAFRGIGMGHSGVIDSERGVVLSFPRPGQMAEWKNVALRELLEREFGMPCLLEDSVRAIATAEKHFGLGRELDDFIYVDVGMGIGAAIFLGGKLYRGSGGSAGELGHMTVDEHGPLCCCGNSGCLETLASCASVIHSVRSAIEQGVDSKIREWVQNDLSLVSVEMIREAAAEDDSLCFRVLNEAIAHIAVVLADVVNLLNPRVLIFGGALFRCSSELFLEPLKRTIRQRALEKSANEVQLKISDMGSEAGALGAARLISEVVLDRLYCDS
jgi:glucokinase-like ROK family protein